MRKQTKTPIETVIARLEELLFGQPPRIIIIRPPQSTSRLAETIKKIWKW